MKIKKLHIQNFKSLVDFQLEDMPQFCAFVGPNASGKSNIFEALEFINYFFKYRNQAIELFGGANSILTFNPIFISNEDYEFHEKSFNQKFDFNFSNGISFPISINYRQDDMMLTAFGTKVLNYSGGERNFTVFDMVDSEKRVNFLDKWKNTNKAYNNEFEIFIENFARFFVGKEGLKKINQSTNNRLLIDGSNTAQILGQIFQDDDKREDFIEWLRILIPEFENIEVKKNEFDGSFHIFVKEKTHDKHFPVTLLSDGTKNILALMAAVYQSNQPQFLCIEEPENGLHPHAIELLVDFFREKCETEGHHIWLNTHSPTLVRCLAIDEVITVNKINGETQARQFKKEEAFDIKMDEAWLTNALGGGVL